jgi:hypothetical protein
MSYETPPQEFNANGDMVPLNYGFNQQGDPIMYRFNSMGDIVDSSILGYTATGDPYYFETNAQGDIALQAQAYAVDYQRDYWQYVAATAHEGGDEDRAPGIGTLAGYTASGDPYFLERNAQGDVTLWVNGYSIPY